MLCVWGVDAADSNELENIIKWYGCAYYLFLLVKLIHTLVRGKWTRTRSFEC